MVSWRGNRCPGAMEPVRCACFRCCEVPPSPDWLLAAREPAETKGEEEAWEEEEGMAKVGEEEEEANDQEEEAVGQQGVGGRLGGGKVK